MHLDLNSCFATIEQQANPLYRGQPLVVAAYPSPGGCILAASLEAKRLGIKTGFRVQNGLDLCPSLIVLSPDPDKYRAVHLKLKSLLAGYSAHCYPKSIDEFVLHFAGYPALKQGLFQLAREIKARIQAELGDYLTVSVGLGPSRFLAKTASNLKKPDGLEEINHRNFLGVYRTLSLTDLNGINHRLKLRLERVGINSVLAFYHADYWRLRAAFRSVLADYWYVRLRGFEVDYLEFTRRSFGNSFALPAHLNQPSPNQPYYTYLYPILQKLIEKTAFRLRRSGFVASGIYLGLFFRDRSFWHRSLRLPRPLADSRDLNLAFRRLLALCPYYKPVHTLSESCFALQPDSFVQLDFFEDALKKRSLSRAIDYVNRRWGEFVLTPARVILAKDSVRDRISFGEVKSLA